VSYRGDYMGAGDYFRGDPGIFGGIAKFAAKSLLGPIFPVAAAVSGPGGKLISKALHLAGRVVPGPAGGVISSGTAIQERIAAKFGGSTTHPIGSSPSGTIHGKKMRLSPKEHMQLVSGRRQHRRINPVNFKALARAERRVKRFVDQATKLIRWVHPHKLGHAVPRFHKKGRKR